MKSTKLILAAILLVGLLVSFACTEKALTLEDVKWSLVSYGYRTMVLDSILPDTKITALFDSKKKEVSGSGGCNTYFANYEVDGRNLSIAGPIAVTEMWCGGEIGEQERIYLEALQTAESYEVKGDNLTIYCGDMLLSFTPE